MRISDWSSNVCSSDLAFVVPEADRADPLAWQVEQENGEVFEGSVLPRDLPLRESRRVDGIALERRSFLLPQALPTGSHRLRFPDLDAAATLIVAPVRCHLPDALRAAGRVWGEIGRASRRERVCNYVWMQGGA